MTSHQLKPEIEIDTTPTTSFFSSLLTEDIAADPVDELLTINLLTEDDLPSEEDPDSGITLEILSEDRFQRARYGVSTRAIWDFASHFNEIMATGLRRLRKETDDPVKRENYARLIQGCIALEESLNTNDRAFFQDRVKNEEERIRWETKWMKEVEYFQAELNNGGWIGISKEPAAFTWNRFDAEIVIEKLQGEYTYDSRKDYLNDPITPGVPMDDRNEHLRQRAYEGFSEWDLKNFRTYLVWIIGQACIFFASKDAHGYPASEERPEFEDHRKYLIEFLGNILRGEANLCTSRAMFLGHITPDRENYADAISKFTTVIPHMWD